MFFAIDTHSDVKVNSFASSCIEVVSDIAVTMAAVAAVTALAAATASAAVALVVVVVVAGKTWLLTVGSL